MENLGGSLALDPFSSQVLVELDALLFSDGSENGDIAAWTSTRQ